MRFLLLLSAACLTAACLTASAFAAPPRSVRDVDWLDRTYSNDWTDGPRRHVGGLWEGEDGALSRVAVAIGDVTGDGVEDAVLRFLVNGGGSGYFSWIEVRGADDRLLGAIPGGDRAHGGIGAFSVVDGAVTLARQTAGPLGGACCAAYAVNEIWRWDGTDFAQDVGHARIDCPGDAPPVEVELGRLEALPFTQWSIADRQALGAIACGAPRGRVQALLGRELLIHDGAEAAHPLLAGAAAMLRGQPGERRALEDLARACAALKLDGALQATKARLEGLKAP